MLAQKWLFVVSLERRSTFMLVKNHLYKIFSVFLSIILSFSLFNFSTMASESTNLVSLQRATGIEVIELPTKLSKEELTELKNNILKYGNIRLSENEINEINQKASARGGLVYGEWFGGYDDYYYASISETISFFSALGAVIVPFLADAGVIAVSAADVISKLLGFIGLSYAIPGSVQPGTTVKADIAKRYREVCYSDGTFAYFQTGFFANDLTVANKYYGSPEAIFSGGLY